MGVFKLTNQTVNVVTLTGFADWTAEPLDGHAANEDTIQSTFSVLVDFSTGPQGFVSVTEFHNITGGTGRFSGATGNFTLHRTHLTATSDGITHVTFGWFEGTISSPSAAH